MTRHALRSGEEAVVAELNDRQRLYLRTAYERDQELERGQADRWHSGETVSPASEWRWMPYNSDGGMYARIPRAQRDPGTGSTWAALEVRGLVERKWKPGLVDDILLVKLTSKGRRIGRACADAREDERSRFRDAEAEAEAEWRRRVAAAPRIPMAPAFVELLNHVRVGHTGHSRRLFEEVLARAEPVPGLLVGPSVAFPVHPDTQDETRKRRGGRRR